MQTNSVVEVDDVVGYGSYVRLKLEKSEYQAIVCH